MFTFLWLKHSKHEFSCVRMNERIFGRMYRSSSGNETKHACSGCQTITRELVTLAYFSACWPRVTRVSTWVGDRWSVITSHLGEYLCGWLSDTAYTRMTTWILVQERGKAVDNAFHKNFKVQFQSTQNFVFYILNINNRFVPLLY